MDIDVPVYLLPRHCYLYQNYLLLTIRSKELRIGNAERTSIVDMHVQLTETSFPNFLEIQRSGQNYILTMRL